MTQLGGLKEGRLARLSSEGIIGGFRLMLLFLMMTVPALPGGTVTYRIYFGTYTNNGSQGIYSAEFDSATGQLTSVSLAAQTPQPSFLAVTYDHKFLYAINELDQFEGKPDGAVTAFSIDSSSGKLTALNQVSSRGKGPAHITLDQSGRYILVANYGGGSVAVFARNSDGSIGELTSFVRHVGSSVNAQRQEAPHAHCIAMSPDNHFAVVADLGIDQLLVYPFDEKHGTLGAGRIVHTDPGVGPRHLLFSENGDFVYVVNELASTVTVYSYDHRDGFMKPLQTMTTLPAAFKGENTDAEIALHPNGKFLYTSNRGDDSIAVFAVHGRKGTLTAIETVSTGGKKPRNFALDPTGEWLLAANEDSNTVVTFRVSKKTGRLTATGQPLQVFSPVMIDFVPLPKRKQ